MPRSQESARQGPSPATSPVVGTMGASSGDSRAGDYVADNVLASEIVKWLDEAKAEQIVALDIRGKTSIGDAMIIATGRSDRHVGAIADQLMRNLKEYGVSKMHVEGQQTCDWVLVDVGAIVVHVFRPEVREFYNLEKMWSGERPGEAPAH